MSPETRALLREAAERGRFDHTAECSWHWRMDSACSCNAASIKSRLRAAADAGEDARNEDSARLDWLERAVPSGEFRGAVERTMGKHLPEPFNIRAAIDAAREVPDVG